MPTKSRRVRPVLKSTRARLSVKGESRAIPADALLIRTTNTSGDDAGGKVVMIDGEERRLNVRPDPLDFRDRMYEPTLVEVPPKSNLLAYRRARVPVINQGSEGSCTGAALATVAHYLLRTRTIGPDSTIVSLRMFYEMAKRYDDFEGTEYSGSSARGAMKGWHKHGVCANDHWRYEPNQPDPLLNEVRSRDALLRPLGAYYRVNHKDLVAMHAAITEVGILYAAAQIHEGWVSVPGGHVEYTEDKRSLGGHAFAIVGYDNEGFWVQNSWGTTWAKKGIAHLTYDDWLANGIDVWVARLGAPVKLELTQSTATLQTKVAGGSTTYSQEDLRPHIVSIGNNGEFRTGGRYGTSAEDVNEIFTKDFPRITDKWKKKRLLLYAHGGLTAEEGALQRVANYRQTLLEKEVYPLAFIWKTDYVTTLKNMLRDASAKRRPEGVVGDAKDFLLDRADDMLEPIARVATGKAEWDEMKENALRATVRANGGAREVAKHVAALAAQGVEIHIVGHSAGSIFHAPIVQILCTTGQIQQGLGGFGEDLKNVNGFGIKVATCTLWAPACTIKLFHDAYTPALKSGAIRDFALFTLTDKAENDDDCGKIYNKSLLYLVSNAFEARFRIPILRPDGEPILGMEKFALKDPALSQMIKKERIDHVRAPNTAAAGTGDASTASTHGGFDDDIPTVRATLARVLGAAKAPVMTGFDPNAQMRKARRADLLG